jgi:hypothetical protein
MASPYAGQAKSCVRASRCLEPKLPLAQIGSSILLVIQLRDISRTDLMPPAFE